VDPQVHPEQSGWSPESDDKDSVNHLRRLKAELAERAPVAAAEHDTAEHHARIAAAMAATGLEERRKSPRLRCSGSAEIRATGNEVRMWGTLSDVSLHGCYVEMSSTFPVDTRVDLVLKSCGIRIQTPGRVRASYPSLGMGICFTETESSQRLQLQQLLALLTGHGAASVGGRARENHAQDDDFVKESLRFVDPAVCLEEIVAFFHKNQLLSRDEFYEIAKRVRQP